MSDHLPGTDYIEVCRIVSPCPSGEGCTCLLNPTMCVHSHGPGSPSNTRSVSNSRINSGNSSEDHGSEDNATSESDSIVPNGVIETNWAGMGTVRLRKCNHGRHAILKRCWGGKHSGMRFLGCPLKEEDEQCQFVEWQDKPWPERVQDCLKELWKEIKTTRRCEATTNEALIDAIRCNDVANNARVELQEEVNRTKRVAQGMCESYHRNAAIAAIDKCKLMYLVYYLIGVVVFLIVALIVKK